VKKRNCKFNKYISHVLLNIENWNKGIKDKTLTINKGDSVNLIETKIYRHLNEYSEENLQVDTDKAKYRR
jgi:hypothetical protein